MSGDVPPPLAAHGCAVVGNMLYIFGGLDAEGTATDQLYALNTSVCIACVCALRVCVHVCCLASHGQICRVGTHPRMFIRCIYNMVNQCWRVLLMWFIG